MDGIEWSLLCLQAAADLVTAAGAAGDADALTAGEVRVEDVLGIHCSEPFIDCCRHLLAGGGRGGRGGRGDRGGRSGGRGFGGRSGGKPRMSIDPKGSGPRENKKLTFDD